MGTNNNSMRIMKDVYWPEKMKLYFEQSMKATPSQFRNFASGNLVREIEDKTRERNATEVSEQDLVNAFLDSIPVFFRGDMIKLLADLGINVSFQKGEKMVKNDIDRMKSTIMESANLAGVSYNEQLIDKIIKAYELNLKNLRTCIAIGTSTKRVEHRSLTIEFVDIHNQFNPYQTALDNNLLPNNDFSVDKLINEISEAVPVLGYSVVFGVVAGIEKIGVLAAPQLPQRLDNITELKNVPESLDSSLPILEKYHFSFGNVFGVNYLKSLFFVEIMIKQREKLTSDEIAHMLADFGYKIPQQNVIELCIEAVSMIVEFSYMKNQPDSISFKMCANSYEEIPKKINNFVSTYAKNAIFRTNKKMYIYTIVCTKAGQYLQIEHDYSGNTVDSITGPFSIQ